MAYFFIFISWIIFLVSSNSLVELSKLPADFQRGCTFANDVLCPSVPYDSPDSDLSLGNLTLTGTKWVSIIVVWYVRTINDTHILPNSQTATDSQLVHVIQKAQRFNFSIMLKPHIDILNNENGKYWRGNIGMYFTPEEWRQFFENYKIFIGHYADIAHRYHVQQLAIGTELITADTKSDYWRDIVAYVRRIFPEGKLTYAANFKGTNYTPFNITWWDALDFIGVDAYYTLAPLNSNPSYSQLLQGWRPHIAKLKELSQKYSKPLIFTEIGYCSQNTAYYQPYSCNYEHPNLNLSMQAALYSAVFDAVAIANSDWFKGIYWWAWLTESMAGTVINYGYTPQHKPAQDVMKKYYSQDE